MPTKIFVCHCEQCKAIKNKRKNSNAKKIIRRLLNKRVRRGKDGDVVNFYWA